MASNRSVLSTPVLTNVDAQRRIDERISEHKAAILALQTSRNTYSAISQLPTELTAKIFLYFKYDYLGRIRWEMNWFNVSGVCRRWRAIVLDTPQLWCSIDMSWQPQCALEVLKRSKSMPLQVRLHAYHMHIGRFEPVVTMVMSHIGRIQELDISVESLAEFLELRPFGRAPALEVLKLVSGPQSPPLNLTISKGVFLHDMQALRTLELQNVDLLPHLPVLPRLNRLIIQWSPQVSASWLIQSLRNTPAIEVIHVLQLEEAGVGQMLVQAPRVSLPKLTFLLVATQDLGMAKVFDYIDYPSSAFVLFSCRCHPVLSDWLSLASLGRLCAQFMADGAISSVQFQWQMDVRDHIYLCHQQLEEESPSHLDLILHVPAFQAITKYLQLHSMLPFASVHILSLNKFEDVSIADSEWRALFSCFHQVTTLHLTECRYEAVIIGLLATDERQRPPLGKLETIAFKSCPFKFACTYFYNVRVKYQDEGMFYAVISLLRQRKELGIAIRKLKVSMCTITRNDIGVLEDHVEVDWDGRE